MSMLRAAFAALVLAAVSVPLWAQGAGTAQISGTVSDPSGAALPASDVTVTQTDTGLKRSVVTDGSGAFVLPNLPIGPYRLEVVKSGFRTYAQTDIVLQVNASPVIPVTMTLGQVSESVEVQANAALVETRNTGVGTVIENQRILELPLNGRDVTALITLSGAAVQTGSSPTYGMRTGVAISVAGGQPFGVGYSLDGAMHSNPYDSTGMPMPFPDAMQEFRVETSALSASQGTHSGASVNGVTKSGTNQIHGDVFEFLRNAKFNARNFFAPRRDTLKRNQFGGTIGGPIMKDKLFFFAGYQGTIVRQDPSETVGFVPTQALKNGDWSAFTSGRSVSGPSACNATPITLRAPYASGNQISPALYSPAALKIAARLPQSTDPCGRITFGLRTVNNDGQAVGRSDYQLNQAHSVFGRYMASWNRSPVPYSLTPDNLLSATGAGIEDIAYSYTVGETWLVSPNVVNSLRFGFNNIDMLHKGSEFFGPQDVGINAYSSLPKYLQMTITGGPTIGTATNADTKLDMTNYQVSDDISLIRGAHQISFGGSFARSRVDVLANVRGVGNYAFNGQETGLGMADFFVGRLQQLRQAAPNPLNVTQKNIGFFLQDTWRVNNRLTLNGGVRWEPFFPQTLVRSMIYNYDEANFRAGIKSKVYTNAPAGFTYPGDAGFSGKEGIAKQWTNFGPRLGLAWDPRGDGKMSLRVGFGLAYDFVNTQYHHNTVTASPFGGEVFANSVSLDNPWATFPGGNPFPYTFSPQNARFSPGGSFLAVKPNQKTPYVAQWNVALQRQVTSSLMVSASYIGNNAVHLWVTKATNPGVFLGLGPCTLNGVALTVCSTNANLNNRRRFNVENHPDAGLIGFLDQYEDGGTQNYHGMLLSTTWRPKRTVNLSGNYTWSRCIGDNVTGFGTPNPGANYHFINNRALDRANCGSDRRHLLNLTGVVESPKLKGAMGLIASGWRASVIYRVRSGSFLTVVSGIDNSMTGFSNQRANTIATNPFGDKMIGNYIARASFASPSLGTFGNLGRNNILGPGTFDFDTAVSREFRIKEGQRAEFRWEMFNVTNTMRKNNPSVNLSQNTFGTVNSAQDPRIMQFALKYVF
jgi:type 1 fimbria pilin